MASMHAIRAAHASSWRHDLTGTARRGKTGRRRAVFRDDLGQCLSQDAPWKHLDVLLNVPRLRVSKRHDDFEELFALGLRLADCQWSEPLEVASDSVLLVHAEL